MEKKEMYPKSTLVEMNERRKQDIMYSFFLGICLVTTLVLVLKIKFVFMQESLSSKIFISLLVLILAFIDYKGVKYLMWTRDFYLWLEPQEVQNGKRK